MKIFNKLEEWIGGSLFISMFIILIMQIFSRQILNKPLMWSEELARFIFIYVGMLGVSIGIRNQQHIYIDFLYNRFPKKMQKSVFTLIQFIIMGSIIFFLYFGLFLFKKKAEIEIIALGISMKWMYLALPFIAILMLIRFYQAYIDNYKEEKVTIRPIIVLIITLTLLIITLFKPEIFKFLRLSNYLDLGDSLVYYVITIWLIMIFLGVPVGWSLFASSVVYYALTRWRVVYSASDKLVYSLDSFSLLSVPFFILTGILMNGSGITERIFNFAKAMLGHYTGGMGHVNVAASLIFSGMSGSAIADAGGLGQ